MGYNNSIIALVELAAMPPVGTIQQATYKNANIVPTNISYISQRGEPSHCCELIAGLIYECNSVKIRGELLRYDYFLFSNNPCL